MKNVSYVGETVLTTDGVGEAVVDYARALVADNSADVVDIPVVVGEGEATASLLLGPAAALLVVEAEDHETTLHDELAIARMRSRAAALGPHRAHPSDPLVEDEFVRDLDFL